MRLSQRLRRLASGGALVAFAAVVLAGCTATGGGSLPSQTGAKKATFAFTMKAARDGTAKLKGAMSDGYVKFQVDNLNLLTVDGGTDSTCTNGYLYGQGTYVSNNKNLRGYGDVDLYLCDAGEPGATSGDALYVALEGGPFDGYTNSERLTGGNLQVKLS
jgi:hypothetical protein